MSRFEIQPRLFLHGTDESPETTLSQKTLMTLMDVPNSKSKLKIESLPFALGDVTGGSESELQTAVAGNRQSCDLPCYIEQSDYFANIIMRASRGDAQRKIVTDLEKYLQSNTEGIWENSWVRFPLEALGPLARKIFESDLMADKDDQAKGQRTDIKQFLSRHKGCDFIRIPISYLLKLSLAEAVDPINKPHVLIVQTGLDLMDHFINDNTSPETSSFYITSLHSKSGMGRSVAGESAIRLLFCQLLMMYANLQFSLTATGQKAEIFSSPHPPIRQKILNNCISDAFYRELFMNPCLSGWSKGEAKKDYMHLCHQVLSRSQMNAVLKLREAGIITSNLVCLPNTSNISLANNGTHVSLGSKKLTRMMADPQSGFTKVHEKYLGDLVIKIVEHFLPLLVGTYSAAPYRLDFQDFHPEKALGFLPHELDYTHLRMLWRRWRKKANLKILGQPVTPFGPLWLDSFISRIFRLRGDYIPDHRLIDYLVCLMSTERSPALDGRLHNSDRLKNDLAKMGVFDDGMSLYLLDKLREYERMGFSGFEGRYYSLFESLEEDMGRAVSLQNLFYLLAFKYIVSGRITHDHIPDSPLIESERRQAFFGAAIGIPTFFVRMDTGNTLMKRIVELTAKVRPSNRYRGYWRLYNLEYRRALLTLLQEDAADLIDMLDLTETIQDLGERLRDPEHNTTFNKLTAGILKETGHRSVFDVPANVFNQSAEKYYRTVLRKKHMQEAFKFLRESILSLNRADHKTSPHINDALTVVLKGRNPLQYLYDQEQDILEERASKSDLERLIHLMLIVIRQEMETHRPMETTKSMEIINAASIH